MGKNPLEEAGPRLARRGAGCKAKRRPQGDGAGGEAGSADADRGDVVVEIAQRGGAGGVIAAAAEIGLRADLHVQPATVLERGDAVGPPAQVADGFAPAHAETVAAELGAVVKAYFIARDDGRTRAGTRRLGLIAYADADLRAAGAANGEAEGNAGIARIDRTAIG